LWFCWIFSFFSSPFWDVRDEKEAYSRWRKREKGKKGEKDKK